LYNKKKLNKLAYRSRVWRRNDFKTKLKDVLMTEGELENCTFEPNAHSLNPFLHKNGAHGGQDKKFKIQETTKQKGYAADEMDEGCDPGDFIKSMGTNFKTSNASLFKSGILK
jgi:hypothetical protein